MAIIMCTELTVLNLLVGGESVCFHHWVHLSVPCYLMHHVLLLLMIWFRGAQLVDSYQIRCYEHQPIHICLWCSLICFGTQCVDMFLELGMSWQISCALVGKILIYATVSYIITYLPSWVRPVTQQLFSSSVTVIGLATHGLSDELCHFRLFCTKWDRLCGLVVGVSGYRYRGPGFDPRRYQIFWVVVGLEWGPLSLVRSIEELLEWKK